jgi:hypothetical protein
MAMVTVARSGVVSHASGGRRCSAVSVVAIVRGHGRDGGMVGGSSGCCSCNELHT